MKTLAELDKAMKEVEQMKSDLSKHIGGGEWIICFYDTYSLIRMGAWKHVDNIAGPTVKVAMLSTDAIIDPGAYTEEELQPVVERIMELSK